MHETRARFTSQRFLGSFALISFLLSATAFAQTTYDYAGNPFDVAEPPYTTADNLVGSFTTANPLPPNFSGDASGLITSLNFSDGQAVRSLADTVLCQFDLTTNSNGAIVSWSIFMRQSDTGATENQHSVETYSSDAIPPGGLDSVGFDAVTGATGCDSIALVPTASSSSVPPDGWAGEPPAPTFSSVPTLSIASLILLSALMIGLGWVTVLRSTVS